MLSITDKEFEDIIDIMNKIYENKKASSTNGPALTEYVHVEK